METRIAGAGMESPSPRHDIYTVKTTVLVSSAPRSLSEVFVTMSFQKDLVIRVVITILGLLMGR